MGEDEGLVLVQYRNRHLRQPLGVTNRKILPPSMTARTRRPPARHATGEGPCTAPQVGSKGKHSCPASRAVMRDIGIGCDIVRVTALGRQATRQKPTQSGHAQMAIKILSGDTQVTAKWQRIQLVTCLFILSV